jgi:hypothetical protein
MLLIYALMIFGTFKMLKYKDITLQLGLIIFSIIIVNWLISLGTLGDHRQRLPILGLIVILQTIGLVSFINRPKKSKIKKEKDISKK